MTNERLEALASELCKRTGAIHECTGPTVEVFRLIEREAYEESEMLCLTRATYLEEHVENHNVAVQELRRLAEGFRQKANVLAETSRAETHRGNKRDEGIADKG